MEAPSAEALAAFDNAKLGDELEITLPECGHLDCYGGTQCLAKLRKKMYGVAWCEGEVLASRTREPSSVVKIKKINDVPEDETQMYDPYLCVWDIQDDHPKHYWHGYEPRGAARVPRGPKGY